MGHIYILVNKFLKIVVKIAIRDSRRVTKHNNNKIHVSQHQLNRALSTETLECKVYHATI